MRMPVYPELLKRLPRAQRIEVVENLGREDFSPSMMVKIARLLRPHAEALARDRQARPGRARSGKLPERTKGQSRDQLAAIFGASGHTLERADAVAAAAERDPSLRHLEEEMDRTGRVDGV